MTGHVGSIASAPCRATKRLSPLLATAALLLLSGSTPICHAGLASSALIIQDISGQYRDQPGYENLYTFAVWVLFESPQDYVFATSEWQVHIAQATWFNADPIADDPLELIDDAAGGHVSIAPEILAIPGYEKWAWDTNLSIENNPMSVANPGTTMTPTQIGPGGVFVLPPYPTAGADLRVQIAQFTVCSSTWIPSGVCRVYWGDGAGGPTASSLVSMPFLVPDSIAPDFNFDFMVDGLDLGFLLSQWSIPAGAPGCDGTDCCPADLNHDGVVDGIDLGILIAAWGPTP